MNLAAGSFALLLLATGTGNDFAQARAEFLGAIAGRDAAAVRKAAFAVARTDDPRAVDALLKGYGELAREIADFWEDKRRVILENRLAGNYDKMLDEKGQFIEKKITSLQSLRNIVVAALGLFTSDASVRKLCRELRAGASRSSSDWGRRAGIAAALGQVKHPEVVPALLRAITKDREPQVRVAAIDAIRALKANSTEAVDALIEQLAHKDWIVQTTTIQALGFLKARKAVGPLIDALEGNEGRIGQEINEALVALTGVDKHGDYATWKAWFEPNRAAVVAGTYTPRPGEAPRAGQAAATTFYGIPIKSTHVVFVLDRSGSMSRPSDWKLPNDVATVPGRKEPDVKKQGDRKIDIARWQLKRALSMMPDGTEFNLIFYNHQWTIFSDKMVKLSKSTRQKAYAFIDSLAPQGRTNIYDPLEKGHSFAGGMKLPPDPVPMRRTVTRNEKARDGYADTIFLMTDGLPNTGQVPSPDGIVAKMKEINRTKKVKIHTIGVFATGSNEAGRGGTFLRQLARDSGGVFTMPGKKEDFDDKKKDAKKKPDPKKK